MTGNTSSDTYIGERENNEDAALVRTDLGLYVVCDGMGGHSSGQLAATQAIQTIEAYCEQHLPDLVAGRSKLSATRLVHNAIVTACQGIYHHAQLHPAHRGMGTTVVMALVMGPNAIVAHVGDSRCYLVRGHDIHQLTSDHTLLQEMLDHGDITPEAAQSMPTHVLTRALGVQPSVQIDLLQLELVLGDTLIVCSDGVHGVIDDQTLLEITQSADTRYVATSIVGKVREQQGSDNATCIVYHHRPGLPENSTLSERDEEVLLKIEVVKSMYLFRDLTLDQISRVLERAYVVTCNGGDVLLREGDEGKSLYIVLSGEFELKREGHLLAVLGSGDHIGEMSILSGHRRTATAISKGHSRLLSIHRDDFTSLVNENPALGVVLLTALARELCTRLDRADAVLTARDG